MAVGWGHKLRNSKILVNAFASHYSKLTSATITFPAFLTEIRCYEDVICLREVFYTNQSSILFLACALI